MALGGSVESIQMWHFIGTPVTLVSGLSDSNQAIVDLAGMFIPNALGVAALLAVPWRKISAYATTVVAVVLCFFIIQTGPLALVSVSSVSNNDGSNFVLHSGCSPLLATFLGVIIFGGSIWLWFWRTRFLDQFSDIWSELAGVRRPDGKGN